MKSLREIENLDTSTEHQALNLIVNLNHKTMKYLIKADINGNLQTEIKCNESRVALWIDYLIRNGYKITITEVKP